MGVGGAESQWLGPLLHRWRACLLYIGCLALLLSLLLVFGFTESGILNPTRKVNAWLNIFLIRSRASFSGMIQSNDSHSPPTTLQLSVPDGFSPWNRQVSKNVSGADDGKRAHKVDKALSVPERSPIVSDVRNTPSIISKSVSSIQEDDKSLHYYANNNGDSQCDVSLGRWVYDDSYPLYEASSCPYVEDGFSCQKNGRPDSRYMNWKWRPKGCEIPRFNATNLLKTLSGKRMVFVGDSLSRNQWESMLCLLREGLLNKSRMFETRGQSITKEKGAYVFQFLDYNCTVEFYRSHYLVDQSKQSVPGSSRLRLTLRLDAIDKNAGKWRKADIVVFTTGHWWNHGKTARGKDFFQEGDTVYGSLPMMVAFRKAMTTWGSWIDQNIDSNSTKLFFCGYSPAHFQGAQWNSTDQCQNEIDPIYNESYTQGYPDKMVVIEDTIRQMKTPVTLLNVTRLSEFRKDAHPSIYIRSPDAVWKTTTSQDCSHWCLPGLPDIWNEILYALLNHA